MLNMKEVDAMAKILLVEDSATQAVEMTMLLQAANHEVVHVANGQLGLSHLKEQAPDLVITDLEMPEINGLQLVESMRANFSHIPSILVTSHGSEELAAEALRRGAAGYVPKTRMSDLLNDTIVDVLGVIRSDASYAKLISTLKKNVFVFDLPSDPELISPLVGLLMQVSAGMELLPSIEMVRLGVAVEHSLTNAMLHGNLEIPRDKQPSHGQLAREGMINDAMKERLSQEPYKSRVTHVEATASEHAIRIVITDQGPGFDTSNVPQAGELDASSLAASADGVGQADKQGLLLIASFVDQMWFNDEGNQITLVKRCGAE
ncbi:response regulator receiver protein [Rhodopirellula baltica SWK14]|uniref:Response regulator receiver protein n=1 Tax=Rhodopirellula baltica SWK14 TaxID=993516 RepID=L7CJC9_RHOBT|nr:response regulator receiver protein [Rhodopirellula baltica SWK14]